MATANYEPNEQGYREMALSPDMLEACIAEAEKGKAFAISISPRSKGRRRRQRKSYAESFDVQPTIVTGQFRGGPRVAALLVNEALHAAALEFGNVNVKPPKRILGRTAAFLGRSGAARAGAATRAANRAVED